MGFVRRVGEERVFEVLASVFSSVVVDGGL